MKTIKTLFILMLAAASICAQQKTVELPPALFANTHSVEIAKVTLSATETVLDIEAFYTPGYWIRIASDSYLQANGQKYKIRSGDGIDLDSLFWMPQSGEASFKLIFEPLPLNTGQFDFIESDCDDCFKIYGVNLQENQGRVTDIPSRFTSKSEADPDHRTLIESGEAIVSGWLPEYRTILGEFSLLNIDPVTGSENRVPLEINSDGSFSASIEMNCPGTLFLSNRNRFIAPIRVSPGKETEIWVNLAEVYRTNSRILKSQEKHGEKYHFAGHLSGLNRDLNHSSISSNLRRDHTDRIADMNIDDYKSFMIEQYEKSVESNNALDISPLAKKIADYELRFDLVNRLSNAEYDIPAAYAVKYKVKRDEVDLKERLSQRDAGYNDYFKMLPFDDPDFLFVSQVNYKISSLSYARENNQDPYQVVRYLSGHENVEPADRVFFERFIVSQESKEEFEEASKVGEVFGKYQLLVDNYISTRMGAGFLLKVADMDSSLLTDLIHSQKISGGLQDFNPLTDAQMEEMREQLPAPFRQALLKENEKLLAKIEENKKKTGYTVLSAPQTDNESLFVEMMEPFKGKVVLVDVWATWCGPCRMAHQQMEPMKAQVEDNDIVFLYLAGEDSPENTWKNMIADISGSHYRLNREQWDYLYKSLNVRGVPTYIILDKEGNQSYYTTGFPGVDTMKKELKRALEK